MMQPIARSTLLAIALIVAISPAGAQKGQTLQPDDRALVQRIVRACAIIGFVPRHDIPALASTCRSWTLQRPQDAEAAKAVAKMHGQAHAILGLYTDGFHARSPDRWKDIGKAAWTIRQTARDLAIRLRDERLAELRQQGR